VRICFVSLGNICRSPTAEAVMQRLIDAAGLSARVTLDSAGAGDWRAMDHDNLTATRRLLGARAHPEVRLLRSFDPAAAGHAPIRDPYAGAPDGFAHVLDLCDAACRGVLDHVQARLAEAP
jgi:protein-tyrosine phosphatase